MQTHMATIGAKIDMKQVGLTANKTARLEQITTPCLAPKSNTKDNNTGRRSDHDDFEGTEDGVLNQQERRRG